MNNMSDEKKEKTVMAQIPTPVTPTQQPSVPINMNPNPFSTLPHPSNPFVPTKYTPKLTRKNPKTRLNKYIPPRKTNFTCPFCFAGISKSELLFYCKECDESYTEKEAEAEGLKKGDRYFCHNDEITGNRMCPSCEINAINNSIVLNSVRLIPEILVNRKDKQGQPLLIGLAGVDYVGKSMYLTRLLEQIRTQPLPNKIVALLLDQKSALEADYMISTLRDRKMMPATAVGYYYPFLIEIHNEKKSIAFSISDSAGEDFSYENEMGYNRKVVKKYLQKSKNAILIIDPCTLPNLAEHPRLINDVKYFTRRGGADTLNIYINMVRPDNTSADKGISKYLKDINLAVVFTKMDIFYDDPDFPSILKTESSHVLKGQYNAQEMENVNDEMRNWVAKNGGGAILNILTTCFPNARLFGISSGADAVQPNRILDPFLWLLNKNEILD